MKFNDLIKTYEWLSVELTLLRLYPDQISLLNEYRNVFEKLNIIEPTAYDELEIVLKEYNSDLYFDSEESSYVDVSGKKKNPDPSSITDSYAIEFLEWDKWLGMDLAKETTKNFSDLEILAHCLYEMTFIDYNEQAIQKQFKSLNNKLEDYKKLTDNEKELKTISLDELKKRIEGNESL